MAAYRYWRLYVTKWKSSGTERTTTGDVRVAEWSLHTSAAVEWPTSNLTGATSPSPFVVTASGSDGVRVPYLAFDGDTSDDGRWICNANPGGPVWLGIDLGSAVDVASFKIAPDSAASSVGNESLIVDFQIEGSTTGAWAGEQVVVRSYTGLSSGWAGNTLRTFSLLTVSGTVLDDAGLPCARVVRAYDRASGVLLGEVTSNATTGAYSLPVGSAEAQVVVLDDSSGTVHQDLIARAFGA